VPVLTTHKGSSGNVLASFSKRCADGCTLRVAFSLAKSAAVSEAVQKYGGELTQPARDRGYGDAELGNVLGYAIIATHDADLHELYRSHMRD
jgi:hypothetical protein